MRKLTFDEAMQHLNEGRIVQRHAVLAGAIKRKVWVAEWHIPGCLSETRSICTTKADAVEAGLDFARNEVDHFPRGLRSALERDGHFQHHTELFGTVATSVERMQLGDLIGN